MTRFNFGLVLTPGCESGRAEPPGPITYGGSVDEYISRFDPSPFLFSSHLNFPLLENKISLFFSLFFKLFGILGWFCLFRFLKVKLYSVLKSNTETCMKVRISIGPLLHNFNCSTLSCKNLSNLG